MLSTPVRESNPKLSRILAFVTLGLILSACTLPSVIGRALGRVDTTPTDCDSGAFLVTTELDVNDGACNTQCSLREAVIAANACEGPDVIEIPEGTYTLSLRGPRERGGDLDVWNEVEIRGLSSPEATVIQGDSTWPERIFRIYSSIDVTLRNLTIRGGDAGEEAGGGIHNRANLTLDHVIVRDNHALSGGGLYNFGVADISDSQFLNNYTTSRSRVDSHNSPWIRSGDALECGGGVLNRHILTMRNSTVDTNASWAGGGICNGRGEMILNEVTVSNNTRPDREEPPITGIGGGIANFADLTMHGGRVEGNIGHIGAGIATFTREDDNLDLQGVSIVDNEADPDDLDYGTGIGAGLFAGYGSFTITGSVIADNSTNLEGGGVALYGNPSYGQPSGRIEKSAIVRNIAEGRFRDGDVSGHGGGVWLYSGGSLELINTTISDNQAGVRGGGIWSKGDLSLEHVTIVSNRSAEQGGGIHAEEDLALSPASVSFRAVVLAHNRFNACWIERGVEIMNLGYNFETDNVCLGGSGRGLDGSVLVDAALSSVDGTFVNALPFSSPALDTIPPGECSRTIDQRSAPRPQLEGCDSGAYEMETVAMSAQPTLALATATPTPQPSTPPTVVEDTLCWKGPGSAYETVSSLQAGAVVELLGISEDEGWWVIDNPVYPGVPCWLPADDLEPPPDLDFEDLTRYEAPPLPTATPTPVQGCLVYDPNNPNDTICKPGPCGPNDSPGGTCTP